MEQVDSYIPECQVSEITGIAVQTLRNDRCLRQGIPFVKLRRAVRYSLQDVLDYMESRKVKTADAA